MSSRATKAITVVAAFLAVVAPILLSIYLTAREARNAEIKLALSYAREALGRADRTANQIERGFNDLITQHAADPCSKSGLALMRKIDLDSSYIQGIGYVRGNNMVCSSLTLESPGLDLGKPEWTQPDGSTVRTHVMLPFATDSTFLIIERDGYAAIVHRDLPIDVSTDINDLTLAIISTSSEKVLTMRGHIKPAWLDVLGDKSEITFTDDDQVVAILASKKSKLAAIAALPVADLAEQNRAVAWMMIPAGVLAGIALSLAVLYLARLRLAMPSVLRIALRRDEFFMLYQPVVDLQTGVWVGAEALMRWGRPDGELVSPDVFIPIAEDADLIRQVTRQAVKLVARDAGDLFRQRPHFHLGINLSAQDLHARDTVEMLRQLMATTGAHAENLMVEITERGFANPDRAREVLQELRSSGISIAIDDFGTGYSSLSYLESFDIDYLKIDKSFVESIGTEAATSQVVQHIVEMAKSLGLKMIAEGVETQVQADFLRNRGVQFAQGWLFAKPMPLFELLNQAALNGRFGKTF